MREMSIRELRDSLSSIDEIAERDGEVMVTRHGKPVARIVALSPGRSAPSHAGLRAGMPRMTVPSEEVIRADRDRTAEAAP